ncbi:MAG: fused MFS/spermidine synthase [Verrucomicrobia bacterium]|nr:fused MFS/spermidine synthase [Verrucomicrobiota bacterium]
MTAADTPPPPAGRASRLLLLAVGGLGAAAVIAQLVLMREMLAAFAGNEMVLGIILGNWLLLTGAGAWLGRASGRLRNREGAFIAALIFIAIAPLVQVFLLSVLRNAVFGRGIQVGLIETVLASFAVLLPFCVASGWLLTLACSVATGGEARPISTDASPHPGPLPAQARGEGTPQLPQPSAPDNLGALKARDSSLSPPQRGEGRGEGPRQLNRSSFDEGAASGIGRVYVADCIGSIAGGALFSFVLVRLFDHLGILYFPAMLNLLLAGALAMCFGRKLLLGIAAVLVAALVGVIVLANADALATAIQFEGQHVVFRGNSPYGKLVVTESFGQYNFIENGLPIISTDNTQQVEETVHYAMAQRPGARRVLVVCGGVSGTAREILKYGVAEVTCVELDPLIIEAGRRFLPANLSDPRIKLVNTDGRLFVKQTSDRYDVVIVDVPDPSTSQLNRFYTAEFFGEVKRVLTDGGVLSFGLGRYADYVSPELARLLTSARRTLDTAFKNTLVIPGGRVFFLASDGPLHEDIATRIEAAAVPTRLVNRHYLKATLAPDRMEDMRRATGQSAALNRDFSPVLYYYHLLHWMNQFKLRFGLLEAALLVLLAVYLVRLRAAPLAVFASGFAASGLEVVLLLAFQILYGSVYQQLGIIVTVFMAGLAAGALGMMRPECGRGLSAPTGSNVTCHNSRGTEAPPTFNQASVRHRRQLAQLAFAIAAFAALLPLCLMALARVGGNGRFFLVQTAIALLTFLLAALVGMQFPLAGRVCTAPTSRDRRSPSPWPSPHRMGRGNTSVPIATGSTPSDSPDSAQNVPLAPAEGERAGVRGQSDGMDSVENATATASRLYTADFIGACLGALLPSTLLIPLIGVPAVCLLIAALNAVAGVVVLRSNRK